MDQHSGNPYHSPGAINRKKANMNSVATPMPGLAGFRRKAFEREYWQTFALAAGLALAPAIGIAAEPAAKVRIGAYAKHVGSKIVYYYRVTNKSSLDITSVSIGHDTKNDDDPGNDVWELSELPSGWNPKLGIPAASSGSPTGWRVTMTVPAEESKTHAITWEIINNKSPVISSGQTLAKMSIALDKADSSYLTGHALVTFSGRADATAARESGISVTVPIEPLDSTPPTLKVAVNPDTIWSPDVKYVPVNVTFPAREDNFDNLPQIRLESITANEPLEAEDIRDASFGMDDRHFILRAKHNGSTDRVYTVTYSATDASGNRAMASATVTVLAAPPHGPAEHGPAEKGKAETR